MPKGVPKNGFRMTKNRMNMLNMLPSNANVFKTQKQPEPLPVSTETIEETEEKLRERFDALDIMADATLRGVNRALIVSGPGGLGKSFGVEQAVKRLSESNKFKIDVVSGFVRPTGMYKVLYENRMPWCSVVFDDSDSVFSDEDTLNLLKKACDTTDERHLSWRAETRMEDEDGEKVPTRFEFKGSIIFITNQDLDAMVSRGHKLSPHLEAMITRSHYLDLAMKTRQDYMVRIKQVIGQGMLRKQGYTKEQENEVLAFLEANQDRLRDLSLRMALKLAGLMKMSPTRWKNLAASTCMRNG